MAQQLIICQILFSIRPISSGSCTDGVIQKSVKVTKCLTCHYVSYQIGVERNVFQKKCWSWSPDVFTPSVARPGIPHGVLLLDALWLARSARSAPTCSHSFHGIGPVSIVLRLKFKNTFMVCIFSLVGCSSHMGLKWSEDVGRAWKVVVARL